MVKVRLTAVGFLASLLIASVLVGADSAPEASPEAEATTGTAPESGQTTEESAPAEAEAQASAEAPDEAPTESSTESAAAAQAPAEGSDAPEASAEAHADSNATAAPAEEAKETEATSQAAETAESYVGPPATVYVTVETTADGQVIVSTQAPPEPQASVEREATWTQESPPPSDEGTYSPPSDSSPQEEPCRRNCGLISRLVPDSPPEEATITVPGPVPITLYVAVPSLKVPQIPVELDLPEAGGEGASPEAAGANAVANVAEAGVTEAPSLHVDVPTTAVLLAATIIVGATTYGSGGAATGGRSALLRALRWVGLGAFFSRLTDDELLQHPRRNEINEYVRQNPGERLENVRRALGISNGSMLHHVSILDRRNLVRPVREGGVTRLFPAGPRITSAPYVPPERQRLLELVHATPGRTQREIAAVFGASERMVSYHLGLLRTSGLVDVQRDGVAKRCFPARAPVNA